MNHIEDLMHAIFVAIIVATFLLNTGRGLKAIQLCQECLIFINNSELKKEEQFVLFVKMDTYHTMLTAYCLYA